MSKLPVTQMVLYKHGVGFFTRAGDIDGEQAVLSFRQDEINDVLKSLVAFDQGAGQVLGLHYQTPRDQAARLADSSIRLSDRASLLDLLRDLRGRRVRLALANNDVEGRVVGIDSDPEKPLNDSLVSLLDVDEDRVHVFRLEHLDNVTLLDERARYDLSYFLNNSLREDVRRDVTIRLSEGSHRLLVHYVAPSPIWRVSYRIVAESSNGRQGEMLIQGWGLFDNRLDEDLEDVQVTLVAGQPISFIYDLYSSRIPERPVVEEEARVAPGPVEFRGMAKRARLGLGEEGPYGAAADATVDAFAEAAPMAMAPAPAPMMQAAGGSVQAAAEGREAGEFFAYEVNTPVSVKRGDSALVPILSTQVDYSRELLYNGAKLADHPVAALRFANTTGLTLERGPVTVVEDGDYKGEAVVPFTKADNEVYLAFAVELGIRVTERTQQRREMAGLDIRQGYLLINEYQIEECAYHIENTTGRDQTVTIEARVRDVFELFDTRPPDAETATERRWQVEIGAFDTAPFVRKERRLLTRHEEVRNLNYQQLQRFFENRWLDKAAYEQLRHLLDNLGRIDAARQEQEALAAERQDIYERQGQLRENLGALKAEGEEAALRGRMLNQLEATEDRLATIEARMTGLDEEIATAEEQVEQILADLG